MRSHRTMSWRRMAGSRGPTVRNHALWYPRSLRLPIATPLAPVTQSGAEGEPRRQCLFKQSLGTKGRRTACTGFSVTFQCPLSSALALAFWVSRVMGPSTPGSAQPQIGSGRSRCSTMWLSITAGNFTSARAVAATLRPSAAKQTENMNLVMHGPFNLENHGLPRIGYDLPRHGGVDHAFSELLLRKLRDPTFRANRPAFTCWGESHAVAILPIKQLPNGAVRGDMRPRRAYSDPTIFRPGHSRAKRKPPVERSPRLAAVGCGRRGGGDVVGLLVVTTDDHAMLLVAECDRENAGRLGARNDRGFAYLPILAAITGTKHPRRLGSARREPDVTFAVGDETRAAGRKGPLALQIGRASCRERV